MRLSRKSAAFPSAFKLRRCHCFLLIALLVICAQFVFIRQAGHALFLFSSEPRPSTSTTQLRRTLHGTELDNDVVKVSKPQKHYGLGVDSSNMAVKEIRDLYQTQKYRLIYKQEFIDKILSLQLTNNGSLWWKHRDLCDLYISTARIPIIDRIHSKIDTFRLFSSEEFNAFKDVFSQTHNQKLPDVPFTQRYFQMDDVEWKNSTTRNEKYNELAELVHGELKQIDYAFVLKPSHLSWSLGIELYDRHKWDEHLMSLDKLWDKMDALMKRNDQNATGVLRTDDGDILNKGVIIEARFPMCTEAMYCGLHGHRPREVKIMTLFGRVVIAAPIYADYFKLFRDGSYLCLFDENTVPDGIGKDRASIEKFCDELFEIIAPSWPQLVALSEVIAAYVGSDRLRVDWFYNRHTFQLNEIAYPSSRTYGAGDQYLSEIVYNVYHNHLDEIAVHQ